LGKNIRKKLKMIDINFDCEEKYKTKEIKKFIEKSVDLILEMLNNKSKRMYLSIFLTNNEKIREINLRFRNINKITNVLSFPQNEERMIYDFEKYLILGDIVLSIEKISSESKEQKKNFWDHFLHMITHSILHLLGYDHENEIDAKMMKKKEDEILTQLSKVNIS